MQRKNKDASTENFVSFAIERYTRNNMKYFYSKMFLGFLAPFIAFVFFLLPTHFSQAAVLVSQPDARFIPLGAPAQSGGHSSCFATPFTSHTYAKSLAISYISAGVSAHTPIFGPVSVFISGFTDPSCSTFKGSNPSQLRYSQFNPYPVKGDAMPVTNGQVITAVFDLTHLNTCTDGCAGLNGYDLSGAPYHRITIWSPVKDFTTGAESYFHIMVGEGSVYTSVLCTPNYVPSPNDTFIPACRRITEPGMAFSFDGTPSAVLPLYIPLPVTPPAPDPIPIPDPTPVQNPAPTPDPAPTVTPDPSPTVIPDPTPVVPIPDPIPDVPVVPSDPAPVPTPFPIHTPVLIIPGVLGTEISSPEQKLWLDIEHTLKDIGDGFMDDLAFGNDLKPLKNNLIIGNVLTELDLLSNPAFIYSQRLIDEFCTHGYALNDDLFLFPYDWRYGVDEKTISQLKQKISDIMAATGSTKVDIVAHSTGGLLVKKYVMENPDSNHIDKAVFVGVPNTGAPKAIKTLLVGDNFGDPFLAQNEMRKLARNFPVVYDLAPSRQYYSWMGSFMKVSEGSLFSSSTPKDLDFDQTNDLLLNGHGMNASGIDHAAALHTPDFDNYDLRKAGVDLYSINGCKTGTIGGVTEIDNKLFAKEYTVSKEVGGDGTVPIESSTNLPIDKSHKYYSLNADHGTMLSQDGIRQEILNLISGNNIPVRQDFITQDSAQCGLNGHDFAVYSPLSIDVVDTEGRHSGVSLDTPAGIENAIPNADYEIIGDHKFVYVPTDNAQTYTITIKGTDTGTFTFTNATIMNNTVVKTDVFRDIPVTSSLRGTVESIDSTTVLKLDTDGDGTVDKILTPTSVLDAEQSKDFIPVAALESDPAPSSIPLPDTIVSTSESAGLPTISSVVSSILRSGGEGFAALMVPQNNEQVSIPAVKTTPNLIPKTLALSRPVKKNTNSRKMKPLVAEKPKVVGHEKNTPSNETILPATVIQSGGEPIRFGQVVGAVLLILSLGYLGKLLTKR